MPSFACPFCENMVPANADTCPYCHLSVARAAAEHRAGESEIVAAEIASNRVSVWNIPPSHFDSDTSPVAQPNSYVARQVTKTAFHSAVMSMIVLWLVPFIGFGTLYHEWTVNLPASKVPPQRISYRELLHKGVADGTHIVLTDFELQSDQVVTNLLGSEEQWSSAFVPVIAIRTKDRSAPLRMVMHSREPCTSDDLQALQDSKEIVGTIFQTTDSLSIPNRIALRLNFEDRQYNGKTCYLLEHGTAPQSTAKTYEKIAYSVVMIVAGVPIYWLTWLAWKHRRTLIGVASQS